MKRILLTTLFTFGMIAALTAQTGPGGVGNSSNNVLWLDASSLSLNDGDKISTWTDLSGNGNDAFQLDTAKQPIFKTNQQNGQPAILFDGNNDFLNLVTDINSEALSVFIIFKATGDVFKNGLLSTNKAFFMKQGSSYYEFASWNYTSIAATTSYDLFSVTMNSGMNSAINLTSRNYSKTNTRNGFFPNNNSVIGKRDYGDTYYASGYIPEVIIFDSELNFAERNIVLSSLAAKYNLRVPNELYSYKSNYNHEVIGIGKESSGGNLEATTPGVITVSNPSNLDNGEYLLIGHNNADFSSSTSVPGGIISRWNRVWRVDKTGDPGTIDIEFNLDGKGLGGQEYTVLLDDDGDFTNGGTTVYPNQGTLTATPTISIKFSQVTIPDGAFFTLALKQGTINSVQSGDWNSTSTWSCSCIPTVNDSALISQGHTVTVSQNQDIKKLTVRGTLDINTGDTLFINKGLVFENNGSIVSTSGTLALDGANENLFLTNSTSSTITLNNLYINSDNALNVLSGDWSLEGSLQVNSGSLDVSNANSFTLISNASTTAEILPSISNAFSGEFTIQRYISNRRANYSNHGAPISDATVADLDDESDIILSGVNGNDGDILFADNSVFHSMFFYDAPNFQHEAITSTSTPLPAGKGFELYLLTTPSYFSGATIDYKGTPANGNISQQVDWKWNLVGNPYQAHLDFDKVERDRSIRQWYQIYNSTTGTYDYYDGATTPDIAPGQGFWIYCSANWGPTLTFKEEDKVSSNSSTFKRRKYIDPYFSLNISNQENPFSHKMRLAFDAFATEEMNESDVTLIPSPIKEAPAIYSKAVNSEEKLIVNSLNPTEESQLVPVSIYAGVEGEYEISADNLDALYDNYSCVYLKDEETEKAIDLMVEPNYSFEAKQGKSDRFHLILSNSYEECQALLKEGEFVQNFDQKLSLRNAYENWYVDYTLGKEVTQLEIRVYNMSGQEVKAPMSFEAHGAGTYPLQYLNDLEGIYLIQIVGEDIFLNKQVKL